MPEPIPPLLTVSIYAFIFACAVYGVLCVFASKNIQSVRGFYHIEDLKKGVVTIAAGNLTLGTGFIFLANLAQQQAVFALLSPVGILIGYILLSKYVSKLSYSPGSETPNLMFNLRGSKGGRWFFGIFSLLTILTFLFILAFELYVSSTLLGGFMTGGGQADFGVVIAVVIFVSALAYSSIGGLRGVVLTDILQGAFIVLMTMVVLLAAIWPTMFGMQDVSAASSRVGLLPAGDPVDIAALGAASLITAVTTQFYNIVNLSVGSNYDGAKQSKLFFWAGIGLFAIYTVVVFVGIALPQGSSSQLSGVDLFFEAIGRSESTVALVLGVFIVIGMVAVLLSSADSFIVSITQIAHDNIGGGDSFENSTSRIAVWKQRVLVLVLNVAAVIPLIWIFSVKPDVVSLLLSSIFALTVLTPIYLAGMYCRDRFKSSILDSRIVVTIVASLVAVTWAVSIWDTMLEEGELASYITILSVVAAVLVGVLDIVKSSKPRGTLT